MSDLTIVQLFPTLLGTYGDGGNVMILAHRARARGIECEVLTVGPTDPIPTEADLYVLGGGEDDGQSAATTRLRDNAGFLGAVDRGAVVFAVCAGLQVIGTDFEVGKGTIVPGVGLLDVTTRRREVRAVGELLAEPDPALGLPILTGYENHGGATILGPSATPLARVESGVGNGAGDDTEGVWNGKVLATYLHGPVLARNPKLADLLLSWAVGSDLAELAAPFTDELRAERLDYVRSGKQSPASHSSRRRQRHGRR